MIDINKGISDLEESFGRQLTDEEKFNIALFGEFMNTFWANIKQNDSDPKPELLPKEEIKPMDIGEVINGLDYCLSIGKCVGCANSESRMAATCRPLVENALRLLKEQAMHKDEIVSNTLKNARIKIEQAGQRGQKEQYHVGGEYGDHGWLHYCKGIRDACWAIDKLIDGYQRHEVSEEA